MMVMKRKQRAGGGAGTLENFSWEPQISSLCDHEIITNRAL
jgi:hypothetical protein